MKLLALNSYGATFELENSASPYYTADPYKIYVNGEFLREDNRNVFSVFGLAAGESYNLSAYGETISFSLPERRREYNVKDFGARGDGLRDDTPSFSAALAVIPYGSALYVPQGKYLLKPIFLKSGVTLYLERGVTLLGSCDRNDYPVLPALVNGENLGTWQGEEADCFAALITAYNARDIIIAGEGVIDCNAQAGDWYVNHRVKRVAWRPRGIFLNGCENVTFTGVTVKNTPSWNIHPYFCKNVKLYDLKLENPPEMPTTDGIDPDCCDGVEIAGVNISVGDDCIAIKSGTLEFAKKHKTPCKNIVIKNCLMRSGHGGVVFGSELSGGIKDVSVTKCLFDGTDRGFRIKTRRGRGRVGACDGVNFSEILMKDVKTPFVINMYYNMGDDTGHTEYVWSRDKMPVDERTPEIGNFTFTDTVCRGVGYCAGAFYGLPEAPIKSVKFKNVKFYYDAGCGAGFPDMREKNEKVKNGGLYFSFVGCVELENLTFDGVLGRDVITEEVGDIKINE